MRTFRTASERVAAGATLLDEQSPGWHETIDVEQLDMASGACCVLGQTYAHESPDGIGYLPGGAILFGTDDPFRRLEGLQDHGFTITPGDTWGLLELEWKREIARRRS